jgi:hypothetical protein
VRSSLAGGRAERRTLRRLFMPPTVPSRPTRGQITRAECRT